MEEYAGCHDRYMLLREVKINRFSKDGLKKIIKGRRRERKATEEGSWNSKNL